MTSPTVPAAAAPDLRRLFLDHRRQLVSFVQRHACSLEDAEDAVQSAFVEALQGGDGVAALGKPSAWLFGTALGLARSQARQLERGPDARAEAVPAPAPAERHGDPADLVALRQMTACLETLLCVFAPTACATFDVVVNGGATYEEAADHLELTVGMVRLHMSHAGAVMRRLIAPAA